MHYQPIVDLNGGAVVGFEVLARIADGKRGMCSIGPVIEAVENHPRLGELLMRQLLAAIRREAVPAMQLRELIETGFPNWRREFVDRLNGN